MKMITDYEVEGCWTDNKAEYRKGKESRCRKCGAIQELVPRDGHFNSKYWELERNDGLYLHCCPNGCSEEDAKKKMDEYLFFSEFCQDGSESYDWKLDFSKFRNAWIAEDGTCYPVHNQGHAVFASEYFKLSEVQLEKKNMAKITAFGWHAITMRDKGFTKKQLDTIFDFCVAHGLETKGLFDDDLYNVYTFKEAR